MRPMKFEIYSRWTWRGKRWYFRLKAGNGEIIAQGEGYFNGADCHSTVEVIRESAGSAGVVWLDT